MPLTFFVINQTDKYIRICSENITFKQNAAYDVHMRDYQEKIRT